MLLANFIYTASSVLEGLWFQSEVSAQLAVLADIEKKNHSLSPHKL